MTFRGLPTAAGEFHFYESHATVSHVGGTFIVEAHSIDDGFMLRKSKSLGFGFPGWALRYGSNFDKPKADRWPEGCRLSIFIQAAAAPLAPRPLPAHGGGKLWCHWSERVPQRSWVAPVLVSILKLVVGLLWVELKQKWSNQFVHSAHVPN